MHTKPLTLPQFIFIVATRGMLGAGVGLLLADKFAESTRRRVGMALAAIGVATTIPAARLVFGTPHRAVPGIDAPAF
jgi:hypothetical protein